ncbi:MAG: hypothetical protein ABWY50_02835 [Aeromicrobium sp.]
MVDRTDGPFEYYQDIHAGVNGDTIRADAHDPGLKAATIGALAGELEGDSRQVAGQLSGDITADVQANPETASATAKVLAAKGHYAVGLVSSFAEMVDTFDTTVSSLNQQYRTNLASAMRYAGQGAASTPDPEDDKQVTEAHMGPAIKAHLQPQYDAAVNQLDNDADTVANKFKQGATNENVRELVAAGLIPLSAAGFYPGLQLTSADKRSYYEATLGTMSAQEQIDWINRHKDDLPPEAADAIRPEVQEQIANDVADDIKDLDDIDEDTVKLLTFLQDQPAFAHQLNTEVSPDQMSAAVAHLSHQAFPDSSSGPGPDAIKNAELYKGFLDAAGATFATFTKGTGAYAPPSDLVDSYYDAITDTENPQNAAALTLLIRHGGQQTSLDDEFMSELTGRVYEWEREHDGDPVWSPLNDDLGDYGIKDPTIEYGDDPDESYDDLAFGNSAYDGLANLLGGMEHTPEGAQDFFMGNYEGSTESLEERMDYLIGGENARTFAQDEGDGLGSALQAAAVGGDTRDPDGTAITNELFTTIAEHSGEGDGWGPDNQWHVWNGMTDSLGTIASGYTGDVYESLSGGVIDSGSTHLDVTPDELEKVLGEIGHSDDKSGLETLTAAMHMEVRNQNIEYLQGVEGPHDLASLPSTAFQGMQMEHGEVMAGLLDHGLAIAEDEDKTEEARAALLSKGLDIAGGFIPGAGTVLGEGASELAKTTYDTISGEALGALSDGVANSASSTTDAYRSGAIDSVPEKLRYGAVSDLYRAGYLDEQDLPSGSHFDGAPDSLFTGQPPTLRPELLDDDGYSLDDTDIPEGDRAGIIEAWDNFHSSEAWDAVYEETYTSTFYDAVAKKD